MVAWQKARGPALALFYGVLAAITLLPIARVEMPALGDFTNNLARIHVMQALPHSAVLQRFFDPAWHIAPYYGMDLLVLGLAQFLPIYAAGRCFAALCLLMPVISVACLRKILHGRIGLAPAFAFLLSYAYIFSRGFLNYIFTVNLGIIALAAWIATSTARKFWHYPALALAACLLYLSHVFGFLAFGLLIASFELQQFWRNRANPSAPWQLAASIASALPSLALAATCRGTLTVGVAEHTIYGSLAAKIGAALSPFYFPSGGSSVAVCCVGGLIGCIALWRWGAARALQFTLAATALAACAMPSVLFNLWGADFRLPYLFALLAIAGINAPKPQAALRILAACALLAATSLRAQEAASLLAWADSCARQTRIALSALPEGAKLLVVQDEAKDGDRGRVVGHLGALATIDHNAFVPFLFTYATPIIERPEFAQLSSPNAGGISLAQLNTSTKPWPANTPKPNYGWGGQEYWQGWPEHFDYVLLLDQPPNPTLPPLLHLQLSTPYAQLYRIGG